jgi:hypothetical protein
MGSCIGTSGDTVHVVWTDKLSTTTAAIYYTHSLDTGITWSTPIALTNLSGNAWNPAIAVNGKNIHVVWREFKPSGSGMRASWYKHSLDGGNTWGPNVFLDSTADWPAVAVSGNIVYVANDLVTAASPYNTEIYFLRSIDNGTTWSTPQQLTFAVGRSEDEAIAAQGSHVHMSWNDNRSGQFQILYKESPDYGITWSQDLVLIPKYDYSTMVSIDSANVDVVAAGAPVGSHYQILLAQSADTGSTWGSSFNIINDTAHTYYYPYMVRNGSDLHVVCSGSTSAKYLHSGDGGLTWDTPYSFTGGSTFIAYTGCALHILLNGADHHVYYMRNPTGNAGHCGGVITGLSVNENSNRLNKVFPDPAISDISIKCQQQATIEILNIQGQQKKVVVANDDNTSIDVSSFPRGVYIVKITAGNEVMIEKFVKE